MMPSRNRIRSILSILLIAFSPLAFAKKTAAPSGDQEQAGKAEAGEKTAADEKTAKKPVKKSGKKSSKSSGEEAKAPAPAEPSSGGGW